MNLMKKTGLTFLLLGTFLYPSIASSPLDSVDPTIGGQAVMLEPTRPTVSLPNSMVRVYPVRKDQLDDQIHSFPLTIVSHRLGELFWLMPCDGATGAGVEISRRLTIRKPSRHTISPRVSMIH